VEGAGVAFPAFPKRGKPMERKREKEITTIVSPRCMQNDKRDGNVMAVLSSSLPNGREDQGKVLKSILI